MAKQIKESAKVLGISYKTTSYYGNPSYWVKFETTKGEILKGYTANNASCGYSISNYEGKECVITYHYTRNGNLIIDYVSK